ncbi:MAG: hypothetical protein AAF990_21615 [Bacteroidota bacterium]
MKLKYLCILSLFFCNAFYGLQAQSVDWIKQKKIAPGSLAHAGDDEQYHYLLANNVSFIKVNKKSLASELIYKYDLKKLGKKTAHSLPFKIGDSWVIFSRFGPTKKSKAAGLCYRKLKGGDVTERVALLDHTSEMPKKMQERRAKFTGYSVYKINQSIRQSPNRAYTMIDYSYAFEDKLVVLVLDDQLNVVYEKDVPLQLDKDGQSISVSYKFFDIDNDGNLSMIGRSYPDKEASPSRSYVSISTYDRAKDKMSHRIETVDIDASTVAAPGLYCFGKGQSEVYNDEKGSTKQYSSFNVEKGEFAIAGMYYTKDGGGTYITRINLADTEGVQTTKIPFSATLLDKIKEAMGTKKLNKTLKGGIQPSNIVWKKDGSLLVFYGYDHSVLQVFAPNHTNRDPNGSMTDTKARAVIYLNISSEGKLTFSGALYDVPRKSDIYLFTPLATRADGNKVSFILPHLWKIDGGGGFAQGVIDEDGNVTADFLKAQEGSPRINSLMVTMKYGFNTHFLMDFFKHLPESQFTDDKRYFFYPAERGGNKKGFVRLTM